MGMYALIVRVAEAQARRLPSAPAEVDALIDEDACPKLDIDKSWHVLHFALTGVKVVLQPTIAYGSQ